MDVCVGCSTAEWLSSRGHEVAEVRSRDCKMTDEAILAWANSEQRILITMDKDFSELSIFHGKRHAGMIRLENLPLAIRLKYLSNILDLHAQDLSQGAVVIQKGDKIRVIRS
jgi:predicted nuclease of predicted toxin-antitoxin system